jgi:membrane-associated protein
VTDAILPFVEDVMSSPWIYLVLFALAAVDGFLPLVPSETSVITAGVFAAAGDPSLPLVILAAGLGAFAGDQVSYAVGRLTGPRLEERASPGGRRRAALDRARGALAARGGVIIVASRYLPGARTAVTLTAGAVGYRWKRFATFGAVAATTWATYSALVGYLGGVAFEHNPLTGLLLGFGMAATVTVAVELVRHLRQRRRAPAAAGTGRPSHGGVRAHGAGQQACR